MATTTAPTPVATDPTKGYSPSKAAFAKFLVRSLILKDIEKIPLSKLSEEIVSHEPPRGRLLPGRTGGKAVVEPGELKIGIIGAGIAGLYSALVLQKLGIKYEILEANPDRIGGRLYTHYFQDPPQDGSHMYYDIGAMRFPDTPIMKRTFDLFKKTTTPTKLGEYKMRCDDQPMRYNDITKVLPKENPWKDDPFKVSTKNDGPVPAETVSDPDTILDDAYYPYRRKIKRALNALVIHQAIEDKHRKPDWESEEQKLIENLERAWNYLLQHDKFSLRDYLSFVEGQDDETIHWLETLNAATGWFDQAFSENVLESLAFEYTSKDDPDDNPDPAVPGKDVNWYYIENGTYKLTENVLADLKVKPEKGKLVTAMSLVPDKARPGQKLVSVQIKDVKGETETRVYDTVINTTTFSALQKMDLTGLKLPYSMKTAIRSLRYDPSTKVGIKFKKPWWINECPVPGGLGQIKGGLGKTDMPLRTCVYPSYNLDDGKDNPAVLLCSYSWGADSERIASMVNPVPTNGNVDTKDPKIQVEKEQLLKETMIDNLARLHSTDEDSYAGMKDLISSLYETHHAYDWSKDPYTCGGAFALYSPTQFKNLYPNIVRPAADSRLHIVGEAASAHHAWIVGALDSSVRGIWLMLERFRLFEEQKTLIKEFGEIGEVDATTGHLQVALGMLKKEDLPRSSLQ
ncbi:MAG: hypothetical protein MMC23_003018 [Stictis urceolatum]|nr:hypothetical protein [Stictis urceolata]